MSETATVEQAITPSLPYWDVLELVSERLRSLEWSKVDAIEEAIESLPNQEMPLTHIFTPGLYTRQILMPKGPPGSLGVLVTSRIHLTEHPFVLSAGVVSVWDDANGWTTLRAPYIGVTKPGTRRILFIHEDAIWTTFHVTNETDPDEIVRQLTYSDGKFKELRMAAAKPDDLVFRSEAGVPQLEENT